MHFLRIPVTPQIRQNPQIIVQRRQKSPLIQREHRYEQLDQNSNHYHIRVHSQMYSPPVSPSNPTYRLPENHIASPMTSSKHQRSPLNNPQAPKSKPLIQHKQDVTYQKIVSRKFIKNTESSLIFRNNSPIQGNFQMREKNQLNSFASPNKFLQKYRKGSCQEGINLFCKHIPRKQSSNQETLTTSRHTNTPKCPKSPKNVWDETNNFQLSTNNSDQNYKTDLTQSQIELPKSNASRKHSDNYHAKKIPSFLSSSKIFRKSFDNNITKTKNLTIQNFIIAKELGKGTFGRVVLAIQKKTKMVCAIKIMSKRQIVQNNMMDQVVRQIKIQMFINHPNVIKVYGFFDDLLHFYIIMESALDGHLSDFLSKRQSALKEEEASVLLYQTCSAISSLHTHSIIHRDLKPQNLMMHEGIIKLSDFGWSVNRGSRLRTTFCGTPLYLCPEILIGDEYDQSVDIWTIGVILYEMLYKSNPFKITCQQQLINILNSPIIFDESVSITESAREVIRGCLQKKAAHRPNIRQLLLSEFVLKGQAADQFKK